MGVAKGGAYSTGRRYFKFQPIGGALIRVGALIQRITVLVLVYYYYFCLLLLLFSSMLSGFPLFDINIASTIVVEALRSVQELACEQALYLGLTRDLF